MIYITSTSDERPTGKSSITIFDVPSTIARRYGTLNIYVGVRLYCCEFDTACSCSVAYNMLTDYIRDSETYLSFTCENIYEIYS